MKKFLASAATAFLIVAGSVTLGSTAANATYEPCVPSEAYTEVVADIEHAAVTHEVNHEATYGDAPLISAAVEYQAAVYEVEYEFRHKLLVWKTKWSTNPNWNAENNENSLGWYATGNTRDGALISAEVLAQEAVYGERPLIKDAWVETVVDEEAYTEVVPDIEHPAVVCATYPPVISPVVLGNVSAPDCDTDGVYSVEGLTPAENANGYEGDGYHFYVRNTTGEFGGPGVYTWEAYGIGSAGNEAYPKGTSVGGKVDSHGNPKAGGKVTGTFEVLPATDDCPVVVPEQPADKVSSVESSTVDCLTDTVTTTVTTTTVGSVYVEETNSWVDGEAVVVPVATERDATDVECPVIVDEPEEPATPADPEEPTVVDEEEVVVTAASADESLAFTGGGDINPIVPIGGGILVLGGLTAFLLRRRFAN